MSSRAPSRLRSRPAISGALLLAAAAILAGCTAPAPTNGGAGFNAAVDGVVNASDAEGGILRIGADYDCGPWDPAMTYDGNCWQLQRLMSRTLTAPVRTGDPGVDATPGQIAPDLATDFGAANEDFTVWTYTLRPEIAFSNGNAITSADLKYGFERLWATDVITGGPAGYFLCLLDTCDSDGTPTYSGPYADPDGALTTIETPDDTTIVFHLNAPTPNFDYFVSLPATAPVPAAEDDGAGYGQHIVSSGPFMIADYKPGQSVTWERNPNWVQSSDDIRHVLVDSIELSIFSNPDDLDSRLKNGSIDLRVTGGVQVTFQSEILNDESLKSNADNPQTGYVQLLILFPSAPGLEDVHCRRAVAYALDKRDLLVQMGGAYGGSYAGSLLPSGVPGHDDAADAYPSGEDHTGDLDAARAELEKCGKADGFDLTMAYFNDGASKGMFASVQAALARVGITVNGNQQDASAYDAFIGSPGLVAGARIGIAPQAWGADFPSGEAYLTLLVDPNRIQDSGSTNYASVDDETINALLAEAQTAAPADQADVYRRLDAATMDLATYIPVAETRGVFYRNPRLTNVDLRGNADSYDVVNLGVGGGD